MESDVNYDAKVADVLIGALQVGIAIEDACAAQDIPLRNYYVWINKGHREPESTYGKFLNRVRQAEERGFKLSEVVRVRNAILARATLNRKRWPGKWPAAPKFDGKSSKSAAGTQLTLDVPTPKEFVDEVGTPVLFPELNTPVAPPMTVNVATAPPPAPTAIEPPEAPVEQPRYPIRDLAAEAAAK